MKGICEVCGSEKNVRFYQKKQVLCGKHREQMRRFGKIRERTLASKNLYINHSPVNGVMEIVAYDRKLNEKGRALIDPEDYDKVSAVGSWCIDSNGYVINHRAGKLHQVIMGTRRGLEIDHINRNKLDNRKENLRFVTHRKNTQNRKTNNTYWRKNGRWSAYVCIDGKQKGIGTFDTQKKAQEVADKVKNHLASGGSVDEFFKQLLSKAEIDKK